MPTKTLINLQPFCCPSGNGRYKIDEPYVMDGFVVATDARIAVRMPCTDPNSPVIDRPYPNHVKLFGALGHDFNDPLTEPFPTHSGAHNPTHRCHDCKGTGMELVECECLDDFGCRKCNYSGERPEETKPCKYCEGNGDNFEPMDIKMRHIRGYFVRLINTLPNARIFTHCTQKEHSDQHPLPFIFDNGGQGLVMPSRPRD